MRVGTLSGSFLFTIASPVIVHTQCLWVNHHRLSELKSPHAKQCCNTQHLQLKGLSILNGVKSVYEGYVNKKGGTRIKNIFFTKEICHKNGKI